MHSILSVLNQLSDMFEIITLLYARSDKNTPDFFKYCSLCRFSPSRLGDKPADKFLDEGKVPKPIRPAYELSQVSHIRNSDIIFLIGDFRICCVSFYFGEWINIKYPATYTNKWTF